MNLQHFNISSGLDFKDLYRFSSFLEDLSNDIGFKVSSRGWAYILEQHRYINKDEFDKVTNVINKCRKLGYLPIDFVAEESARSFNGVENPSNISIVQDFELWLRASLNAANRYIPDWWEDEEYYIQMVVEKVDLVTLFEPVCRRYHIPIANSKGWSSILQRAEYARRFEEAERKGLKCVLLYCGDHDPDGLRISEFLRKNLTDLKDIEWSDGFEGYNPRDLIIDRFGLNYDFIQKHNFTWIDNLTTGSGKNLASPGHKNYNMPYVQDYLSTIGIRKCEANAIVVLPIIARTLAKNAIEKYLGLYAEDRFKEKRQKVVDEFNTFMKETNSNDLINKLFDNIRNYE